VDLHLHLHIFSFHVRGQLSRKILGSRCGVEALNLQACYAALVCSLLPTFQGNLSSPSWRVEQSLTVPEKQSQLTWLLHSNASTCSQHSSLTASNSKKGPIGCPKTSETIINLRCVRIQKSKSLNLFYIPYKNVLYFCLSFEANNITRPLFNWQCSNARETKRQCQVWERLEFEL